jgi:phosphoglycerate dehydrogenase-like enzyme
MMPCGNTWLPADRGAALEVYDRERPIPANIMFNIPNAVCTPHVAAWRLAGNDKA